MEGNKKMKKTKFIALTLVVAFALSGIAFAAWTDFTLFNVNADTGKFQIVIRDLDVVNPDEPEGVRPGVPGLFYYGSNVKVNGTNDFDGTTADPDLERVFGEATGNAVVETEFSGGIYTDFPNYNTLTINARNLFPGVYATFGCEIMNQGTVPAALDSVILTYGDDMTEADIAQAESLWVEVELMLADAENNPVDTTLPVIACFLKDFPAELEAALADYRFDPSYRIIAGEPDLSTLDENGQHGAYWGETQIHNKARIGMNETEYNWQNEITEDKTYFFSIQYNWKQWNMPQAPSNTNPETW